MLFPALCEAWQICRRLHTHYPSSNWKNKVIRSIKRKNARNRRPGSITCYSQHCLCPLSKNLGHALFIITTAHRRVGVRRKAKVAFLLVAGRWHCGWNFYHVYLLPRISDFQHCKPHSCEWTTIYRPLWNQKNRGEPIIHDRDETYGSYNDIWVNRIQFIFQNVKPILREEKQSSKDIIEKRAICSTRGPNY